MGSLDLHYALVNLFSSLALCISVFQFEIPTNTSGIIEPRMTTGVKASLVATFTPVVGPDMQP